MIKFFSLFLIGFELVARGLCLLFLHIILRNDNLLWLCYFSNIFLRFSRLLNGLLRFNDLLRIRRHRINWQFVLRNSLLFWFEILLSYRFFLFLFVISSFHERSWFMISRRFLSSVFGFLVFLRLFRFE